LMLFHKKARKHRWDVEKYNKIKQGINTVETDLRKIRDPLQIHCPSARMEDKGHKSAGFFGITNLRDVIQKLQWRSTVWQMKTKSSKRSMIVNIVTILFLVLTSLHSSDNAKFRRKVYSNHFWKLDLILIVQFCATWEFTFV